MHPSHRNLHVPVTAASDVKPFLAKPSHWREGYSAHALATTWCEAFGLPPAVVEVFATSPVLAEASLLDAFFERETDLRDGLGRSSQTDLLALVRISSGLAVLGVEGRVEEPFGSIIGAGDELSAGQRQRLDGLRHLLGVAEEDLFGLRYQLFHRAVAAVFEAERYSASTAVLLIHSFSPTQTSRADFERFCDALGMPPALGVRGPMMVLGINLYGAWVADELPSIENTADVACALYGRGDGKVEPAELRRLLIDRARQGQLITYGEIATAFSQAWHQGFGSSLKRALNILGAENRAAGEPLLMALVVNKDSREPGSGFYEQIGEGAADAGRRVELLARELELCREWPW